MLIFVVIVFVGYCLPRFINENVFSSVLEYLICLKVVDVNMITSPERLISPLKMRMKKDD